MQNINTHIYLQLLTVNRVQNMNIIIIIIIIVITVFDDSFLQLMRDYAFIDIFI